jgi:rubrerythrin
MATAENLQAAFAGESQANRRYLAFARKADAEGYTQIAKLFRAAAEAETVHALSHFRAMGGVKGTAENLQAAIEGEGYEFKEMYPKFLAQAEAEGNKRAVATFRYALEAEKVHHALYSEALNAFNAGKDLPQASIFVCSVCGYTVAGAAPDECPACGARREKFGEVA